MHDDFLVNLKAFLLFKESKKNMLVNGFYWRTNELLQVGFSSPAESGMISDLRLTLAQVYIIFN